MNKIPKLKIVPVCFRIEIERKGEAVDGNGVASAQLIITLH